MRQIIEDEICNFLENKFDINYTIIQVGVDKIVSKYLSDYYVICDNTNNYTNINDSVIIDIYAKQPGQYSYTCLQYNCKMNKNFILRNLRKNKLNKIYVK